MPKVKFNLKTKNLFIYFSKYVVKLPLSFKSAHNIFEEINNYNKAINTNFFKKYMPKKFDFFYMLITQRGRKIKSLDQRIFFKFFLYTCIKNFDLKEKVIHENLKFKNLSNFISKNLPQFEIKLNYFKMNTSLIVSPSHGDLHSDNIIKIGDRFFIIDWLTYEKNSSFVFDILNYKIISSKLYDNNWFYFLKKFSSKFSKFLEKKYFICYMFWKIENELKYIKIDKYKVDKYKKILEETFLNTNNIYFFEGR